MLAWEERNEQCMVSTFVDGIDNGVVEDVIVYRASYSLIRLIQCLGRIKARYIVPNSADNTTVEKFY